MSAAEAFLSVEDFAGVDGFSTDEEVGVDQKKDHLKFVYSEDPEEVELLQAINDSEVTQLCREVKVAVDEVRGREEELNVGIIIEAIGSVRRRIDVLLSEKMDEAIGRVSMSDVLKDSMMALLMYLFLERPAEVGQESPKTIRGTVLSKVRWVIDAIWKRKPKEGKEKITTLRGLIGAVIGEGFKVAIGRLNNVEDPKSISGPLLMSLSVFASRYIGPPNLAKNVKQYVDKYPGWEATFALELENSKDLETGGDVLGRILTAMDELVEIRNSDPDKFPGKRPQVSVKITGWATKEFAEGENFEVAKNGLRQVFQKAKEKNILVMIDLEKSEHKDASYQVFKDLLEEDAELFEYAGIVDQCYLVDSFETTQDLVQFARKNGKRIQQLRIVKGAYHGYEKEKGERLGKKIVFENPAETNRSFLRLVEYLFQNQDTWERMAFATMNKDTAVAVLELMIRYNIPIDRVETQQLKGMVDQLGWGLRELCGVTAAKYIPWGERSETALYGIRRLVESPEQYRMLQEQLGGPLQPIKKVLAAKVRNRKRAGQAEEAMADAA